MIYHRLETFFKASRQRSEVKINGQVAFKCPSNSRGKLSLQDHIFGALLQDMLFFPFHRTLSPREENVPRPP